MDTSTTMLLAFDLGTGNARAGAILAAIPGLISVVLAGLSRARAAGRMRSRRGPGTGRNGAIVATALGLIGMALAGLHLATSTGGVGTGNGRAGAVVAAILGLIGAVLGGLAVARSRHAAPAGLLGTDAAGPSANTDAGTR
ncbi:DUF6223 family protein [Yinghuangia sp. ASG 101]|uniref:DUF6223 family protein n=1 Tax=Yinghuangia sp. ASG 101 TaxID=2896848 RepID=UPI001E2ECBDA|nr:DUF6223 family protein [Yinghuangia sp. ASG 101]UGQ12142.1 DUF6223 family protein [Yinghuangia sp. ASG 101]